MCRATARGRKIQRQTKRTRRVPSCKFTLLWDRALRTGRRRRRGETARFLQPPLKVKLPGLAFVLRDRHTAVIYSDTNRWAGAVDAWGGGEIKGFILDILSLPMTRAIVYFSLEFKHKK